MPVTSANLPTLVHHPASAALAASLDAFSHLDWPVSALASRPHSVFALVVRPRYCSKRLAGSGA